MYSQLQDEKNAKALESTSPQISPSSSSANHKINEKKTMGPRSKNKNLELQESLMDDATIKGGRGHDHDHDHGGADVEAGSSSMVVNDDDPFYVFKEDLQIKLEMLDDGLERYERIVQITDTAVNTHEVKEAKKQLKRHIKNAESTLKDLQTTVRLVEKKRDNFQEINDSELYHRKTFISASSDRIKLVKTQMNSDRIKSKILTDEKAKSKRRLGILGAKTEDEEETEFIAKSHANTQLMMQQQDETLDELDDVVGRVSHMAENIHEELGQQNKLLDNLEEDLTNAEEQLGLVMGKLGKLLKTKSRWQLGIIMLMTLAVIVLFFMVLYT